MPACGKLWYVNTGLEHAAFIETSGTPRAPPTTFSTPFWKDGRSNSTDRPPPPALGLVPPPICVLSVSFHATDR